MTDLDPERIKRRITKLSTSELLDWADVAASGIMRHLDSFRRTPDEAHLGEISLAAVTMGYVVDELAEKLRKAREPLDSASHAE